MNELNDVNWIAVIVGGVAASFAGFVMFHKSVFGTKWAEGTRIDLDKAAAPFPLLVQLAGFLLMSLAIGVTAQLGMMLTGTLMVLAIAVLVLSISAFAKKTGYAMIVDFLYMIIAGVIIIAIHAIL